MRLIKKILYTILLLLCSCQGNDRLEIVSDDNFPQWVRSGKAFSDQTSGITYIGNDKQKSEVFLIADDSGSLHYLRISEDKIKSIRKIKFSREVNELLASFPKKDFEEILFDRGTNKVYVSIEGNGPEWKKYAGIYEFIFKGGNVLSGEVLKINKLNINPEDEFLEYTADNIGYEGLACDKNYFYLGLESTVINPIFSDKTFIYVVDKSNYRIIKKIDTINLGVATICGLCCRDERELLGIDRNRKTLFKIKFDSNFNVESLEKADIKTSIPGYKYLDYMASLESIAVKDNFIYVVDDPWRSHFIPGEEILSKTSDETRNNFNKFIPIIFKYKLKT